MQSAYARRDAARMRVPVVPQTAINRWKTNARARTHVPRWLPWQAPPIPLLKQGQLGWWIPKVLSIIIGL